MDLWLPWWGWGRDGVSIWGTEMFWNQPVRVYNMVNIPKPTEWYTESYGCPASSVSKFRILMRAAFTDSLMDPEAELC